MRVVKAAAVQLSPVLYSREGTVAGESRMTVYASGSTAGTFDYQPGDVAYLPKSMPHHGGSLMSPKQFDAGVALADVDETGRAGINR